MRRILIRGILPIFFCLVPFLAATLIVLCIPREAMSFFAKNFGLMEVLIIGGGVLLFVMQMILAWIALFTRGTRLDESVDRWISHLAQAAEWFPMLGLIGTVAGILEAFATHSGSAIQPRTIAPAITATGAGLLMALINILPSWIVLLGGDLIMMLSGPAPKPPGEAS